MKYRMTTRLERPVQQAIAYLLHSLIFIVLAFFSQQFGIVLLCAFLSFIAIVKAINLFASAIFYRDALLNKNLHIGSTGH